MLVSIARIDIYLYKYQGRGKSVLAMLRYPGMCHFPGYTFCSKILGARSKFWGVSGSEDSGGGDKSIQFINIGREGEKSFKEWRRKMAGGGGRVGDNSILTFLCYWLDKKNATLRTAFWAIFSIRIFNS